MTIKQKILDHLNAGYALCYGQANNITNSQSGYRRMQEILKENPEDYEYVKVKSFNGGYYNSFVKKGVYTVKKLKNGIWYIITKTGAMSINGNMFGSLNGFETKKEALAQIKKVVR